MNGAPRRGGDSRNSQILTLLNELGDRLVRSEKERFTVRAELAQSREALEQLENRAEQTERIFLTIQDRINKQEGFETRLLKRQEELERLTRENAARLERTEALTAKIEEAIILQNRLARRLERTAQDKARILSKIERIESSVAEARDVFASSISVAPGANTNVPQAVPAPDAAAAQWWQKPLRTKVAFASSVLVAGLLAGVALTQLTLHWPAPQGVIAPVPASAPVAPAQETAARQEPDVTTDEGELSTYKNGQRNETDLLHKMENNPDAVAEMLNRLEPSVASTSAEPAKAEVTAPPEAANAEDIKAEPAPIVEASFTQEAKTPAITLDNGVEDFIKAARNPRPLAERIKPDSSLPPVIKQVEAKAFEGVPEAQHDLAAIYTAGHGGVEVNYSKAAAWFQEAAVNGVANARYNLGVLYHQGLGVERDVNKAINWYRAAADKDHPEAEYNLGIAYIEGIGTQYDPHAAAKYFQKAAQGGVMEAAYNLGLIHENGLLGDPDMNEALYWYKMASNNNPEARVAYDQIVKALSLKPADISRVVKEYSAVYGLDGDGKPVGKKAAAASVPAPPPPRDVTRAAPLTAADQTASAAPLSLEDIPPLSPEESRTLLNAVSKDQTLVSQVQEQLVRLGLYPGPADGMGGPQTEDAIRAYQARNKLSVTGKASEDLLVHMLATELNAAVGANE